MTPDNQSGPFFVISEGDIQAFPTIADATGRIETYEVLDGLTRMFDGRGQQYELVADSEAFKVSATPTGRLDPVRLKSEILEALGQTPCSGVLWKPDEIARQDLEALAFRLWQCESWNRDRLSPLRRLQRALRKLGPGR